MEHGGGLYLVALNVALAALVLIPLLAAGFALVREAARRLVNRQRRIHWEHVPGLGDLPVLHQP